MAGYYAERNSMTLKHVFEIVQYKITGELNTLIPKHALREFNGDKYQNLRFKTQYKNTNYKYILAPFYLAAVTYKGKKYDVVINGVSGEVACSVSFACKKIITLLIILGIIAAAIIIAIIVF